MTSRLRALPAWLLRLRRVRWATVRRRLAGPPPARPKAARPTTATDARYSAAWWRLARAVVAPETEPPHPEDKAYDGALAGSVQRTATRHRGQAELAEAFAEGRPLEQAVAAAVRRLARSRDFDAAWALSAGVDRLPGGAAAARIGRAVLCHRQGRFADAWAELEPLPDEELAEHLPVEAVDAALAAGTTGALQRARAVAARTEQLSPDTLVDLAGRFLVMRDAPTARQLASEAVARDERAPGGLDERHSRSLQLTRAWLDHRGHAVPPGALPVAVIDYQSPDQALASGNVGDYIQTLALVANLARLSRVTYTGEDGLGDLVTELQAAVRPPLRVEGTTGAVHLFEVNRDFSSTDPLPTPTWMVAFGWHMHPVYDLRYDFPYHPDIRPIFVSFHVNRLDMLSDEALEYLRRYGPVGCRDWTTVHLLLSAGVDAFFTGCMTSTVDAVFPSRASVHPEGAPGVVGVVDLRATAAGRTSLPVEVHTHQVDEFRHHDLVAGVRGAHAVLADYQRRFDHAVTRRLHAYLPLTAIGVPVRFKPWVKGDVRFPGLSGLEPGAPRLAAMQDRIRSLVADTLSEAIGGATEDEVYAHWRERTAADVAEAKERFAEPVADEPTTLDVPGLIAAGWAASARFGPHDALPADATDVVLCFDQNLMAQVPVTIESAVANATGPLRLWLVTRGLGPSYRKWLAEAFPDVPMTFLPFDHVDYGPIARVLARITVSTMDRLLLPAMLTDVHRLVYVDVDTLVLGDVTELGRLDLGSAPLAARDSVVSGVSEWRAVGRHLSEEKSLEIQRRMGRRHGFHYGALNAGVLVLDLDRMRQDRFTETYLGWVQAYGLNDQDVMLAYAGSDRLVLDPRWNALPYLETVTDPQIVHWAQGGKPWWSQLAPYADQWRAYDERLRTRAGSPPDSHD